MSILQHLNIHNSTENVQNIVQPKLSGTVVCYNNNRNVSDVPVNPLKFNSSNNYTLTYRSNLPFLISDIRALWHTTVSARISEVVG